MSTLKVTNIQDTSGGNSSTTADIYDGRAKAWVNFRGSLTVLIRASFNVDSITDNGTGDYTVNFTTALEDENYSVCTTGTHDWTSSSFSYFFSIKANNGVVESKTSSGIRLGSLSYTGNNVDLANANVSIFR